MVKFIKRLWVWGLGLFLLAVVLSSYVSLGVGVSELQVAVVKKGGFTIEVNSVGTLDAARSHIVSSKIKGNNGKIIYLMEDGKWVDENETLIKFDPSAFEEEVLSLTGKVKGYEALLDSAEQALSWEKSQVEREIKVAELNLKTSMLELSKLVNGDGPLQLAQLRGDMKESRQEFLRYKNFVKDLERLEGDGFSNPAEINLAKEKAAQLEELYEISGKKYTSYKEYILPSQIESARANISQAKIESEQSKKGGAFKIAKAGAAVEKARQDLATVKIKLKQAQMELDKTVVKAPFKGIVVLHETYRDNVKRKPRVSDTVWQNQPILYLPDITSMVVKTKIREIDLHKIRKDQKVRVKVDAYPDVEFSGKVASIGALAKSASGNSAIAGKEKYFQLTISVDGQDTSLRPGMTARVSVLSGRVQNALIVPVHSIFEDGGGKYCYIYADNDFKKIYIKVGRQNEDFAEILSGLGEGDTLSLTEPGISLF